MNKINLLPKDELQRRGFRKYYKYIIMVIVLLIVVGIYFKYDLNKLEDEKISIENSIQEANKLDRLIEVKKEDVLNVSESIFILKYDNLPLNNLVYFISKELPEDVQLIQVASGTYLDKESKIKNGIVEEVKEELKDKKTSDDKDKKSSDDKDKKSSDDKDKEKSDGKEEDSIKNELTDVYKNADYIVFRGVSLTFDDVSEFTLSLEDLEYFGNVTLYDVKSYYNGYNNFNVFEIRAELSYE